MELITSHKPCCNLILYASFPVYYIYSMFFEGFLYLMSFVVYVQSVLCLILRARSHGHSSCHGVAFEMSFIRLDK